MTDLLESDPAAAVPSEVDGKPTMAAVQANLLVHKAGIEAQIKAEAQGADPADVLSLLSASDHLVIGDHRVKPITAGFLLMLPLLNAACERGLEMTHNEHFQMMAMVHAAAYPREARQALRHDSLTQWQEMVFTFAEDISLADLQRVTVWILGEIARMKSEEDAPGKPTP
jgi:hypothetical protein